MALSLAIRFGCPQRWSLGLSVAWPRKQPIVRVLPSNRRLRRREWYGRSGWLSQFNLPVNPLAALGVALGALDRTGCASVAGRCA